MAGLNLDFYENSLPAAALGISGRHNRVFQDKTVIQIVESVFADYADLAARQWADEVAGFLSDTRPRSYCVQYGESDYAFVSRLLAEEGLGWCVEEDALHDTEPDLFDLQEHATNHACVKKHLAIASQYGIESAGSRRHFAMLALILNDDFAEHSAMQAVLKHTLDGGDYAAEIASLPADFWQQTERKH